MLCHVDIIICIPVPHMITQVPSSYRTMSKIMTSNLKCLLPAKRCMVLFVALVAIILSSINTNTYTTNAFVIPSYSTAPTTRISTFTSSSSSTRNIKNDRCNHRIHNNNDVAQLRLFNDGDHHHLLSLSQLDASTTSTSATTSPSYTLTLSSDQKSIFSVGIWCLLDITFRRIFQRLDIASKFPSSLGGCGVMLTILLLLTKSSSSTATNENEDKKKNSLLHRILSPGAALLAKWLPVFFVPSLVTLPLVGGLESLGGSTEILKTLAVVVGGFFFTLLTTAGAVIGVGKLMGKEKDDMGINSSSSSTPFGTDDKEEENIDVASPPQLEVVATTAMPDVPVPVTRPFSDELMKKLRIVAILSGLAALEGASPVFASGPAKLLIKLKTPILSLLLGSTTLSGFVYGSRLSKQIKKIIHPLITCSALTWAVMVVFAKCTGRTFFSLLSTYKMGKGFHGLSGTGAGDILLFALGPAVMSLSISMYDKRDLIRDNFLQIISAVSVSSIGGLFGTAWMVRLMGLTMPSFRVALLSRNITSPLAMAIAGLLGASASTVSIAVSLVVVTGLFGANFGAAILTAAGIQNPVARGMSIGAAAHGLGTAAFVDEKDAFPFAAISMALTATACTCLVSVPVIKKLVLQIALNGAL